jgi:hypothetical protein
VAQEGITDDDDDDKHRRLVLRVVDATTTHLAEGMNPSMILYCCSILYAIVVLFVVVLFNSLEDMGSQW